MTNEGKERRWFNTEIPLWGVMVALASVLTAGGGWMLSIEFRTRTNSDKVTVLEKSHESVQSMSYKMNTIQEAVLSMKDDMKVIAKLNVDVLLLQRDVMELQCRNGGRCEGKR